MTSKKCNVCNKRKALDSFENCTSSKGVSYYRNKCRECRLQLRKEQRASKDICIVKFCESRQQAQNLCNKHYLRKRNTGSVFLSWEVEDPNFKKCKDCLKVKPIEDFGKNRLTCKICHQKLYIKPYRLKKDYGITENDLEELFIAQNYLCDICKVDHSTLKKGLEIDHCHTNGDIRGLLCSRCNLFLGRINDDIEILKNAIFYLEKNKVYNNEKR